MLTQSELKEQLNYDPKTGIFTRIHEKSVKRYGKMAGTFHPTGYIHIYVKDRVYKAHRLAWLYVHGKFPYEHLDHINRDRADNRIINLREANNSQNSFNKKMYSNNKSGIKGVHWHKLTQKWAAVISYKKSKIHLGLFNNLEDAKKTIIKARKYYHNEYSGTNE